MIIEISTVYLTVAFLVGIFSFMEAFSDMDMPPGAKALGVTLIALFWPLIVVLGAFGLIYLIVKFIYEISRHATDLLNGLYPDRISKKSIEIPTARVNNRKGV